MRKKEIILLIIIILAFIGTLWFTFNDLEQHLLNINFVEAVQ